MIPRHAALRILVRRLWCDCEYLQRMLRARGPFSPNRSESGIRIEDSLQCSLGGEV
jgi:hypothetical protein